MSGKIVVIEGTDGSGKSTQILLLEQALKTRGVDYKRVTFPRYDKPSSALLSMYLNGEFGEKPSDVSAKAASVFFAVDRYASFMCDWKDYYAAGGLIICDRYTTSNAVHQTPKLPKSERAEYVEWLFDFEYATMGIPKPDKVLFLDMPPECALRLLEYRQGDAGDIHEKDHNYLAECHKCAIEICNKYDWTRILCTENGKIKSQEKIAEEILGELLC